MFDSWVRERLSPEDYDRITRQFHKPWKLTKADLEDIHAHYKAELGRLKHMRRAGEVGRIEVESWYDDYFD